MKNNKLIKSLAAMTLAASLFAGAASLVSAADDNSKPAEPEIHNGFNPKFFDNLDKPSGEQDAPENRPADPAPLNPEAINVPGNGEKPGPDGKKEPSSTDKKEEAPAVKKALPKTSAVK